MPAEPRSEPPYGIIWGHLSRGEIIPFLGAGASLSRVPAPPGADPDPAGAAPRLPTGRELARRLAKEASFPSDDDRDREDLAKVASYYQEAAADRESLRNCLREVFEKKYTPGLVHHFLADVSVRLGQRKEKKALLIVTTNYDDLIEQAFASRRVAYHLVVHPTDRLDLGASVLWWKPGETTPAAHKPQQLPLSLTDTTIIYKMHGSVCRMAAEWDSFVISEEDYVEFLSRMTGQNAIPARFMAEFLSRRFLFLGYGLGDWNFRVMLRNLQTTLIGAKERSAAAGAPAAAPARELRSWAIQKGPSKLEESLWRTRMVNIHDMDIDSFVTELRKVAP